MFFYILNENTYISALKNKNHIVVFIHRNTIPRGSAQNFQWISHVRKRKALKCNLVVSHTYKNYFVLMIVFRETIIVGCWIQCIDFLKYWMYYYGFMSHIWTGMQTKKNDSNMVCLSRMTIIFFCQHPTLSQYPNTFTLKIAYDCQVIVSSCNINLWRQMPKICILLFWENKGVLKSH